MQVPEARRQEDLLADVCQIPRLREHVELLSESW